ncbi:hypothetical protein FRB91_009615 [Serendipita sp. 411]|nr:hypothetical protein FRB91_009615 [Serendipita sp. 411]
MLAELFSSLIPRAQAEEEKPAEDESKEAESQGEAKEEQGEAKEEQEEEPEPEDPAPAIREECSEAAECKSAKTHFEHCTQKVQAGEGFKHEDCVEEMCTST